MRRRYGHVAVGLAAAVLAVRAVHAGAAAAAGRRALAVESILYSFEGGRDGAGPNSRLVADSDGNFYGTTGSGGIRDMGTLFRLTNRRKTVLHFFTGMPDGRAPTGDLLGIGTPGTATVLGTTRAGGDHDAGTVYQVSTDGRAKVTYSMLYSFTDGSDGRDPMAGLVVDEAGNFYGTTSSGGEFGFGTVFELTPTSRGSVLKVLHSFTAGRDGASPVSNLVLDRDGDLLGTTQSGGGRDGTIFTLTPATGRLKVLHSFLPARDGTDATLTEFTDLPGTLYGTAALEGPGHAGTAFRLTLATRKFEVVFAFHGTRLGANPIGALAGCLCGATFEGGAGGGGTVFILNPDKGTASLLHSFGGVGDGLEPGAGLLEDEAGHLFGTTRQGGQFGNGTVFEVAPNFQ